ncbi:MAG: hypothetical protein HKO57_15955, partial [Akkermansiaceae bacterium]|nr:hypothetical protein [Akkermansiaceae bacterium]
LQPIYRLDRYANLAIYQQGNPDLPGYNPNEEHAIAAAANRAALKIKELGEDVPNNPPLAAFPLQMDINVTDGNGYTSDPWVLVQVDNLLTGEPDMAAYQVFKTRDGNIPFPRPSDTVVNATPGLAYESAEQPENRFLTVDPDLTYDFDYQFRYQAAAGDLLIPPYPLNLVIGTASMRDARGKNIQVDGRNQRTLWRDVNATAWVVSGDGAFFHQFFYPFRGDFYLPGNVQPGTPVAWLPPVPAEGFTGDNQPSVPSDDVPRPEKVVYETIWRSGYPKLKRGETLTFQGGEYFNETPGSNGLPALVAMAATEVVYDSATPSMVLVDGINPPDDAYDLSESSARIIRPLDRREKLFRVSEMETAGFSPAATTKLFIIAERWYFRALPGSLQKRFYFDSLAEKLVFRGLLNDKESGDPNLTSGPDPINTLEPNVMTADEYARIRGLSGNGAWQAAIDDIYLLTQNPHGVFGGGQDVDNPVYLSGIKDVPLDFSDDFTQFFRRILATLGLGPAPSPDPERVHLDSFGVGSALVPCPDLLLKKPTGSLYITVAENNRSELDGAPITLHIIEIIPDRFRGAIKVIEAADAFSEKITLQHNGDFGANTQDIYYEWWIRDSGPLDVVAKEVFNDEDGPALSGTLKEVGPAGQTLWQEYIPKERLENGNLNAFQKHLGSHTVVFEGRPDVVLADKLVLMRYRHKTEDDWRLVPFEITNPPLEWLPANLVPNPDNDTPAAAAPFQWAGAANSPQLQASGEKRYVPQLVMGWVKRVLDRINPYEARYTDFFSNESPATYSSMIQIAGPPFAGKVALNSDKNVIERTGLIELYETVLARARELSIDNLSNPVSTDGINQAILLAATRLAVLYELLAREAYSDAQDPTITVSDDGGLMNVASFTHAFQNYEATLQHEELALLRGTDFRKSYPVYNRMFWNYAKGLGEAAYNVNYNIYDYTGDGFINEDDARALYPQGHGDAWGHYLSALGMHYELLRQPVFVWRSRSELYSLLQNVIEVDYLDERTFAKLAAGKALAGRDIVRGTYRLNYTQDVDGQWQGYSDGVDPARAWGVSEWAHRTGQAAYFDWAVANAILPEDATQNLQVDFGDPELNAENLDRIQRSAAIDEIGLVAGGLLDIQNAMDEANNGVNPLGFDSDALAFDLNVEFYDNTSGGDRRSHFEQIHARAVTAGANAMETLAFAAAAENKLRRIADDTDALILAAFEQDVDFRGRLIEIFGRPYDGTVGFGKVYPEGYIGPDTLLFAYLDRVNIDQIIPSGGASTDASARVLNFSNIKARLNNLADNAVLESIYYDGGRLDDAVTTYIDGNMFRNPLTNLDIPVQRADDYAFLAQGDWGQRTSYGQLQTALEEILAEEIVLQAAVDNYIGFLGDFDTLTQGLLNKIDLVDEQERLADVITGVRAGFNTALVAAEVIIGVLGLTGDIVKDTADALAEGIPTSFGFSVDIGAPARGVALGVAAAAKAATDVPAEVKDIVTLVAELIRDEVIAALERDGVRTEAVDEIEGIMAEIEMLSGSDGPLRAEIGSSLQRLQILRQEYFTTLNSGFSLLREREVFNKVLAASVQQNRYQDMVFRLARNEAMTKYQAAFNHAARYAWLAARAYDYETSLEPGHPAAPGTLLDKIVRERQLGLWVDGAPVAGQGGLAEILASLGGNFEVLKGQLGIEAPQSEVEKISMRSELFRIGPPASDGGTAASDDRWEDALKARIVPDLTAMPEFVRYCRPFSTAAEGPQPGLVIRFSSHIENGLNFFGRPLGPGDHTYSAA